MAILPTRPELTSLNGADLFHTVDVDNTSDDPTGSSRKITASNMKAFISPPATQIEAGISEIATDDEIFNKDNTRMVTGEGLFNNLFFQEWSSGNATTGLAQLVPSGDPGNTATIGYNLLTDFLEANESLEANIPITLKNISGSPQATFLDETNNKFLFPSNIQTFNTQYIDYGIRIVFKVDFATTNNGTTKFYIRLRRVVDNSFVFVLQFSQSDFLAENDVVLSASISTFVNSELDPFVIDGTYLDILNDNNSINDVTLQDVNVRIFRN